MYYKGPIIYFPIYLTNWGNTLNTVYAVLTVTVVTWSYVSHDFFGKLFININLVHFERCFLFKFETSTDRMKNQTYMPVIFKVIWFLQSICPVLALNITMLYWGFVHNKGGDVFI